MWVIQPYIKLWHPPTIHFICNISMSTSSACSCKLSYPISKACFTWSYFILFYFWHRWGGIHFTYSYTSEFQTFKTVYCKLQPPWLWQMKLDSLARRIASQHSWGHLTLLMMNKVMSSYQINLVLKRVKQQKLGYGNCIFEYIFDWVTVNL